MKSINVEYTKILNFTVNENDMISKVPSKCKEKSGSCIKLELKHYFSLNAVILS